MANLPYCRVAEAPPFTFCGVEMFGPFIIKQRRSQVKRYGATFTCMSCQAVHIEITHFLDTDSFILALRRLIARRENIQTIFADNGSNFIDSEDKLRRAFEEMDKEKLQSFMQASGIDWILGKGILLMPPLWLVFRNFRSIQFVLSCLLRCKPWQVT